MDNNGELRKGFILELKGPRGSGKTTFLNGLMEFLKTDKNINIRKVENEDLHSLMVSYESFDPIYVPHGEKTFHNSDISRAKVNVPDIVTFGDGDMFKLLSKASSKKEGWMKSTKAMEIEDVGCVVQVTTQQHGRVAEAVCFVPDVRIQEFKTGRDPDVTGRKLTKETL